MKGHTAGVVTPSLAVLACLASLVFLASSYPGVVSASPRAPGGSLALELDDGTHSGSYGVNFINGTGARFTWLNRFTPRPVHLPHPVE